MSDNLIARIARGEGNVDIVGQARKWFIFSGLVLLISLVGLFGRKLNLGQEFTGGTSLRVSTSNAAITVADVEDALGEFQLEDVTVQIESPSDPGVTGREIHLRSAHIDDQALFEQVQTRLAEIAGHVVDGRPDLDQVSITDVGPIWGRTVSTKALQGLIIFLILVSLYITLRFEWKMAAGALISLFHDLIATAGLYALVGFVVTPATVIALLTLLGFSLYDTVVIYDRIKENEATLSGTKGVTYSDMVNRSTNEVMMRSINTSLSTLLPISSLLFVGVFLFNAETLKDLSLAMFLGSIMGSYSSIFIAAPFLAITKEREPRFKAMRARISERAAFATAGPAAQRPVPSFETAEEEQEVATSEAPSTPGRAPLPVHRVAPRPRRKKRGKRRR